VSTLAVVMATMLAALIAAGAAILASVLTNRNAEHRAHAEREHQRRLDGLTDLRRVADDAAVALWRLWGAYGPFMHAMNPMPPQVMTRYPGRSPVGGDLDPRVWRQAFDDLSSANMRLLMRGRRGAALAVPVGRAKDAGQGAWNDIMLQEPSDQRDPEGTQQIMNGVSAASQGWREFMDQAKKIFGGDFDGAVAAHPDADAPDRDR
jgi:hypothetical protein